VLQYGRFVRLRSPFEGDGNETAWMCVSEDRRHAVVGFYRVLNRPAPGLDRLPLRGLEPGLDYRVSVWPAGDDAVAHANALVRGGDDLAANGLLFDVERHETAGYGDFWARLFVLEAT
jgi:alpha-galactosidase